ncbi:MAG: acyltransferase [Rhodococcus sp. (in: high G+C Gram-positive bacteria)]|nr:acyltransferase [Rhodococcus sp. (in: high G+C Gram-positive bacteria)]MDI6630769.1 acyltransferase [Rhodococcus sp. (in: high G+C Gram-positive bacteria)]
MRKARFLLLSWPVLVPRGAMWDQQRVQLMPRAIGALRIRVASVSQASDSCRLADVLDLRANGLNFLRLLLASQVILWHTYAVQGVDFPYPIWRPLVSSTGVDGFFAVSGFLILMSWHRRPHARDFLTARCLRILPAFYVVLFVTVLIIAPLGVAIAGNDPRSIWTNPDSYAYIWKNVFLWIVDPGVAGTPFDVPYAGSWNVSLWTLWWEFACYLGVMGLGLAGLAGQRRVIAAIFVGAMLASIAVAVAGVENHNIEAAARLSLMFSSGMVMYSFRDVVRVNIPLVVLAITAVICSVLLPDYRILAALPMAYLLMVAGGALRHRWFRFRTDVSYGVYIYAFPVQQLLVIAGLGASLAVGPFALLALTCTLPLAWLSWTFVEKPSLRLKRRTGATGQR